MPYGEADYFVSPRNYKYKLGEHEGVLVQVPSSNSIWDLLSKALSRSINAPIKELGCGHTKIFHGETEDWCVRCGKTVEHRTYSSE